MKIRFPFLLFAGLAATSAFAVVGSQGASPRDRRLLARAHARSAPDAPRTILVKFKLPDDARAAESLGTSLASRRPQVAAVLERHRASSKGRPFARVRFRGLDQVVKYQVPGGDGSDESARALLAALRQRPEVEYAEPNLVFEAQATPDDPYYASSGSWGQAFEDLWGLRRISAEPAWAQSQGQGVVVAVIDTGLYAAHPDLATNVWTNPGEVGTDALGRDKRTNAVDDDGNGYVDDWQGWDFTYPRDNNPADVHGHGTHVAGTIAAVGDNAVGVIGVAPLAKVMAVRVLDAYGSGWLDDIAAGIVYAANNGARVLNLSLGGTYDDPPLTLRDAIAYAHDVKGALVVTAAGNYATDVGSEEGGFFPAAFRDVMAVAATDHEDKTASFSNFGAQIDVAAPGGGDKDPTQTVHEASRSILSLLSVPASSSMTGAGQLVVGGSYVRQSGTSMSAPHVSGVAALVLALHPAFTPEQVRQALRKGTDDVGSAGFDPKTGYGRVSAQGALAQTQPLSARLTGPSRPMSAGEVATVKGTVGGAGLSSWTVAYGPGPLPTSWTLVSSGSSPVTEGPLASFDLAAVGDGAYTLRLLAESTSGASFEDRMPFTVDSVTITSPSSSSVEPTVGGGQSVSLSGSVEPAAFQSYTFVITGARTGFLASPDITLPNGGLLKVHLGLLGTWNTAGVPADHYQVCVVVVPSGPAPECVKILVDPTLHPGWPQALAADWRSPMQHLVAADLNGDGRKEVLVSSGGQVQVFQHDGQPLPGWPQWLSGMINHGPTVGDLTGDGQPEVVAGDESGQVFVWSRDGMLLGGWPRPLLSGQGTFAIADVNGDGGNELVAADSDYYLGEGHVTVVSADGVPLAGWPVSPGLGFLASVAVGDVDGDGTLEIVAVSKVTPTRITVLRANGAPMAGWPQTIDDVEPEGQWVDSDAALGDFDGDGALEIVIGSKGGLACVFRGDGSPLSGWPRRVDPAVLFNSPALADLDGDGSPEVVMGGRTDYWDDALYAWRSSGQPLPGWPVVPDEWLSTSFFGYGAPIVADVDGNGGLDVVVSSDAYFDAPFALRAYRADGTQTAGFPRPTRTIGAAPANTAVVADLDGDGLLELAWIDIDFNLFVWDLPGSASGAAPWPMFRHDAQHTGRLSASGGGGGQTAVFDPSLGAPRCTTAASSCDSGDLLNGRGNVGPEPHQPNTLFGSCTDGSQGSYHVDESNDRIRVSTLDAQPFAPGKTVRVEATVWAYGAFAYDQLDLFYAADAASPDWTYIATLTPSVAGSQTLAANYVLPAGAQQAVRARFRYGGSAVPCATSVYDDHDDLVFAVGSVQSGAPVADPGGPYTGFKNDIIQFDGTGSYDPQGSPLTYQWSFGDGTTDEGPTPWHFYSTAGTYVVTLIVSDGTHSSTPATTSATVTNRAPVANAGGPYVSVAPQTIAFLGGGSWDPDGDPLTYQWNFGDGNTATGVGPQHAYATPGTYTVTLVVSDGTVSSSPATTTATVLLTGSPAVYDPVLRVPKCAQAGSECDSGNLLNGRGTMGPEPHQPNTIGATCPDNSSGRYRTDESNERIRVSTLDGTTLAPGKTVRLESTVWAYTGTGSDKLDLYYAADAGSPVWTYLTTIAATVVGQQTLSTTYTLPTGAFQAVRARFRWGGTQTACQTGSYTDHDDLAFATQDAPAPIPLTVNVTGAEGGRGTITVTPPALGPAPPGCSNLGGAQTESCTFLYPPDTVVSLSRIAEPDSKFLGWSGACTGEGVCDLALSGPGPGPTVDALFLGPRSLTVNVTGVEGGRGRIGVIPQPLGPTPPFCDNAEGAATTSCNFLYPPDTVVSLSNVAEPDSKFLAWSGACSGNVVCDVPLAGPGPGPSVNASFLGPRLLTLTVTSRRGGQGALQLQPASLDAIGLCTLPAGSASETCVLRYPPDAVVAVSPQPAPESVFVQWGGACVGNGPCQVALAASQSLSALFEIPNRVPTSNPGGPYSSVRNQAIAFDGSASSDLDGDPLTFAWTFGDGSSGTGPRPTHAYSTVGVFTVTLVVNDGLADSPPASTTVTIANLAPSVVLTSPTEGALFVAPASIPIAATASDPDGSVVRVEFFAGPTKIGEATSPPYTTLWNGVGPGAYALTARVTDEAGGASVSGPVNVLVDAPPSVVLTQPDAGTVFTAPANIMLTASASDPDGTVSAVEFFQGSTSLGTVTSPPFTVFWNNAPPGAYQLTARATDDHGIASLSPPVAVTVQARATAAADAYVRDGSRASRNFGGSLALQVRQASSGNNRWTYLRFDTSGVDSVSRAVLRLFGGLSATTATTVRTSVFACANTTWSESGITWNNRPATGTAALATTTMVNNSTTARWYEWDVTSYLQAEKAVGRSMVTLVLKNVASSTPYDTFNSKEAGSNVPELIVIP